MNVESDLVDQICFEERLRQHSATEYTDVFAFFFLQPLYVFRGIFSDECYLLAASFFDRAREDVSLNTWTTASVSVILHRNFIRAPAHHHGVNILPVVFHYLLHFFAPKQPVD